MKNLKKWMSESIWMNDNVSVRTEHQSNIMVNSMYDGQIGVNEKI